MFKALILAGASVVALSNAATAAGQPDRPMFAVQPGLRPNVHKPTALPVWSFAYKYAGTSYSDIFVGTKPATGVSTTIPVYIIPVKLTYGTTVRDPLSADGSGKTEIDYTVASPIFQTGIDYKQGAIDVGNTQYIDAYQRFSFWGKVKAHTGYHVLLGAPVVKPEVSFTVPTAKGKVATAFGVSVIEADINWFDAQIQPLLTSLHIPANSLPIFVTTDTYLTSGGCCIGGYHSYTGTQAYSHFTYINSTTAFSADVSALSHEVAEWLDDPETNNNSPCGIYENGDPLENGQPGHNYGDWVYALNGFNYHLQDLATPVYFGAPPATTGNKWKTFQGVNLTVCQNGA